MNSSGRLRLLFALALAGLGIPACAGSSLWPGPGAPPIVSATPGPTPPTYVAASKGTDTAKIIVTWNASSSTSLQAAASYEIWRGTTFSISDASYLAVVLFTNSIGTTHYDDTTPEPGSVYYYWIRGVTAGGLRGDFSAWDYGYQALMPPQALQATDGVYTNRVALTWAAAAGASSYKVYRSAGGSPASLLYHTAGLEFTDTLVSGGVTYAYQVQSIKGPYASALSAAESGYLLGAAAGLRASKGAAVNRVAVQWNAAAGAVAYEVWRSPVASSFAAVKIGDASGTSYADTSAQAGSIYYYWVKARSLEATGGLSDSDYGYAATAAVDLYVSDLVVLPRNLPAGSHPAVISFRLRNNGPADLAAPNTTLRFTFYLGASADINQAVYAGAAQQNVSLAAQGEAATVVILSTAGVTLPSTPGNYYLFMRAAPAWPNLLANVNPNTSTRRSGQVAVAGGGAPRYWTANDYDGDGRTDLAAYEPAQAAWGIRTIFGQTALGVVGSAGPTPTVGDYDGDRKADPALYDAASGLWSVLLSASGYAPASAGLGVIGGAALPGDYDGDGKADPVIFDELSGVWYGLLSASGYAPATGQFGGPGLQAVPGDYDGDGRWDLAVYQEAGGAWYIRSATGALLKWGEIWGGPGYRPVSGDFDGDGRWDMAVYHAQLGYWKMETLAGKVLSPALSYWGGPGSIPVSGDFDGDGIADQAVYQSASGRWSAITMSGVIILDAAWGSASALPVQWP